MRGLFILVCSLATAAYAEDNPRAHLPWGDGPPPVHQLTPEPETPRTRAFTQSLIPAEHPDILARVEGIKQDYGLHCTIPDTLIALVSYTQSRQYIFEIVIPCSELQTPNQERDIHFTGDFGFAPGRAAYEYTIRQYKVGD